MAMRGAALRVGLLIVGGAMLLLGFLWFFGDRSIGNAGLYESYFNESVQGLEIGSAVKYRGVSVGRVTDIGLTVAEYQSGSQLERQGASFRQVFVRFALDRDKMGRLPDADAAVKQGLRARLAAQGITGLSYIELDFVDPAHYPAEPPPPWQPRATVIPAIPSTLSRVQDAAQQALAKLNTIDFAGLTAAFLALVQDLREELDSGDLHRTAAQLQDLLRTLQVAVQAADLPGLSAAWRRGGAAVDDTMRGADMQRLLAGGAQAADRLARATAQLPPLIAALQATAQRTDSGSAELERALVPLLRDMQATAQNLRELTEALRRAPAQVLLAPPPPRATGGAAR
jgi:ABC-type transporter Mla subunit MlaD